MSSRVVISVRIAIIGYKESYAKVDQLYRKNNI
jgi:hypothetical protein